MPCRIPCPLGCVNRSQTHTGASHLPGCCAAVLASILSATCTLTPVGSHQVRGQIMLSGTAARSEFACMTYDVYSCGMPSPRQGKHCHGVATDHVNVRARLNQGCVINMPTSAGRRGPGDHPRNLPRCQPLHHRLQRPHQQVPQQLLHDLRARLDVKHPFPRPACDRMLYETRWHAHTA